MIYEYALDPEMVATWGEQQNFRFFIREFGIGKGRIVSRYPKDWIKRVSNAYVAGKEEDRMRFEEIIKLLKATMIKRKNYFWEDSKNSWIENVLQEHDIYPFNAILSRINPDNRPEMICESDFDSPHCIKWDIPHGKLIRRNSEEMIAVTGALLSRCRWVKFIDPYLVTARVNHKISFAAFLKQLATERPVRSPECVEIHTSGDGATRDHLTEFYGRIIPCGMKVTIYLWKNKFKGQSLHNRYILTDLGGISFNHGLDTGAAGDTDDVSRLDLDQYIAHCKRYNPKSPAFELAEDPLELIGK